MLAVKVFPFVQCMGKFLSACNRVNDAMFLRVQRSQHGIVNKGPQTAIAADVKYPRAALQLRTKT